MKPTELPRGAQRYTGVDLAARRRVLVLARHEWRAPDRTPDEALQCSGNFTLEACAG